MDHFYYFPEGQIVVGRGRGCKHGFGNLGTIPGRSLQGIWRCHRCKDDDSIRLTGSFSLTKSEERWADDLGLSLNLLQPKAFSLVFVKPRQAAGFNHNLLLKSAAEKDYFHLFISQIQIPMKLFSTLIFVAIL